jgi:hypothetical protein
VTVFKAFTTYILPSRTALVISDLAVGIGAALVQYDSADACDIWEITKTGRNKNKNRIIILYIK